MIVRRAKKKKKKKTKATKATPKKATKEHHKEFRRRGGSTFSLSVNGDMQHDIIVEEVNLGGTFKMKGETDPFAVRDLYRAVLFFMWGIPLDYPIDKQTEKGFKRIIARMQREDPKLFRKHQERIANLKTSG